jgi:hypothetical protein
MCCLIKVQIWLLYFVNLFWPNRIIICCQLVLTAVKDTLLQGLSLQYPDIKYFVGCYGLKRYQSVMVLYEGTHAFASSIFFYGMLHPY